MSGWTVWADVLQEEETPAMGGMSALLSPPSGRGMVKTHLDKFAHTKKKGTLVYVWYMFGICFSAYCLRKIEECVYTKTQSEDTEDDKHLTPGRSWRKLGHETHWNSQDASQLLICILQVSVENSHKIGLCPNTKDHPQSLSSLNLKFSFWLFSANIMKYYRLLPESTIRRHFFEVFSSKYGVTSLREMWENEKSRGSI